MPETIRNTLAIKNLTGSRAETVLFNNITFHLNEAEAIQITGENGSGKTSLLRIITLLNRPVTGDIFWQNESVKHNPEQYKSMIQYAGHQTGLKSTLTVIENLRFYRFLNMRQSELKVDNCLEEFNIDQYKNRICGTLSAGVLQKVSLVRLWLSNTKLWLMDEPATALDVVGREKLKKLMQRHLSQQGLIIFTSHQPIQLEGFPVQQLSISE